MKAEMMNEFILGGLICIFALFIITIGMIKKDIFYIVVGIIIFWSGYIFLLLGKKKLDHNERLEKKA